MSKKILIEATHSEETRVAVVENSRLVDFDCESTSKRPIKGNIYLAKVIRVEPSLQAAFVEYGGNRHGFLAFSEIHPDYFRIPVEDRTRLEETLKAQRDQFINESAEEAINDPESLEEIGDAVDPLAVQSDVEEGALDVARDDIAEDPTPTDTSALLDENGAAREPLSRGAEGYADILRKYKIQEVIKSRQILLVQAIKEERGNKGAALTTYVSLPGRYCVLMPNASSTGGVSRKITDHSDRKRLKQLLQELGVPEGMGLIVRTAGMDRSKTEIKRDYKYLVTLWSEIRESTLQASAPALVYEEGNLVKRVIRDYYARDIDEILVEGDEAYKLAKTVMRKVVPSHSKKVQPYKAEIPLFYKHNIEKQIDEIYQSHVRLKSGGYLVIHPTEALVSVDVNSGRATRERHIDSTALKTNLEAAEEVARQVRLRDLAGLIVIDFIDMVDSRHNTAVEKRLRESLSLDRARIQVGRISLFGLLEMSRQRLRPSIQELSTAICHTCTGSGYVRSVDAMALQTLRLIGEHCIAFKPQKITVTTSARVGFYLLNEKKHDLASLEDRFGVEILLVQDDHGYTNGYRIIDDKGVVISDTHELLNDKKKEEETKNNGRNNKRPARKFQQQPSQEKRAQHQEEKPLPSEGEKVEEVKQSVESSVSDTPKDMPHSDGTPNEPRRHHGGRHRQRPQKTHDKELPKEQQVTDTQQPQDNKKPGEYKSRNRKRRYRKGGAAKREGTHESKDKPDVREDVVRVPNTPTFVEQQATGENNTHTGGAEKKGPQPRGNRKGWWKRLLD